MREGAKGAGWDRTDVDFTSQGTRCAAWLYRPVDVPDPPVVVMAHGFAAEKSFGLEAFAERFAARGLAVFVFDYRCFGASEGAPRNWVSPARHLEDWRAALAHVRGLSGIDAARIALWGSSFGGGHVVVTAARDGNVAAVVSQVPFVDGLATVGALGPAYGARAVLAGMRDLARDLTGRSPCTVPVVGTPGTFAVMNRPDCWDGYRALVPEGSSWQNACPARVFLTATMYRPIRHAPRVKCPALVVMAEQDSLIPARAVDRLVDRLPRGQVLRMPIRHFEVYTGPPFEEAVEAEARFLCENLGGC